MLMNRPGSDSVGYGLNVARIPRRMKAANSASCLCTVIKMGYIWILQEGTHWNLMQTGNT
jgi:hypothetical protein